MVLAEFPWQIFLSPFGIPIVAIVCVFAWLAIQSISEAVSQVMCNRNNSELKLELLARGYSSDEIVRVIEAGEPASASNDRPRHQTHAATGHAAPH